MKSVTLLFFMFYYFFKTEDRAHGLKEEEVDYPALGVSKANMHLDFGRPMFVSPYL